MRRSLLIFGFVLLFAVEILRVYFIMPFPGSQKANTIVYAYWLNNNIVWLRILGLLLIAYPLYYTLTHGKRWTRVLPLLPLAIYAVVFYFFNFRFEADKMFYQPTYLSFKSVDNNKATPDQLVIGVVINGEAKAYPIQVIGYHHQVRDSIGNTPIMVTYCTVCRTGRVYSPEVNGKLEKFRLVGMDHFNAMFEDATTKSWWMQATGVAITGPLKGTALKVIPSQQVTWASWVRDHPRSLLMDPDTSFQKQYDDLAQYDKGNIKSSLEKRDSGSWKFKSWVIGVAHAGVAKAYDWNELVNKGMIQDSISNLSLVIVLEKDTASFHVWNRSFNGETLSFQRPDRSDSLMDVNTHSVWNMNGTCVFGSLKGAQLNPVQASQEFWHSWKTFHPNTRK